MGIFTYSGNYSSIFIFSGDSIFGAVEHRPAYRFLLNAPIIDMPAPASAEYQWKEAEYHDYL
jgi:hypothetical protein